MKRRNSWQQNWHNGTRRRLLAQKKPHAALEAGKASTTAGIWASAPSKDYSLVAGGVTESSLIPSTIGGDGSSDASRSSNYGTTAASNRASAPPKDYSLVAGRVTKFSWIPSTVGGDATNVASRPSDDGTTASSIGASAPPKDYSLVARRVTEFSLIPSTVGGDGSSDDTRSSNDGTTAAGIRASAPPKDYSLVAGGVAELSSIPSTVGGHGSSDASRPPNDGTTAASIREEMERVVSPENDKFKKKVGKLERELAVNQHSAWMSENMDEDNVGDQFNHAPQDDEDNHEENTDEMSDGPTGPDGAERSNQEADKFNHFPENGEDDEPQQPQRDNDKGGGNEAANEAGALVFLEDEKIKSVEDIWEYCPVCGEKFGALGAPPPHWHALDNRNSIQKKRWCEKHAECDFWWDHKPRGSRYMEVGLSDNIPQESIDSIPDEKWFPIFGDNYNHQLWKLNPSGEKGKKGWHWKFQPESPPAALPEIVHHSIAAIAADQEFFTPSTKLESVCPPYDVLQSNLIVCQPNVEHAYRIIRRLTGNIGGNGYHGPIYGELTMGSMQKIVNLLMKHTGFGKASRFIDVGSGIGKPNIHVAQDPGVAFSCGVEVHFPRWTLGMINLKAVLQEAVAQQHANNQGEEDVHEACCLRGNTVFLHKDITEAKTFDPFSHVYMFSIGFPLHFCWSYQRCGIAASLSTLSATTAQRTLYIPTSLMSN